MVARGCRSCIQDSKEAALPENRAGDDQQCTTRCEGPAFFEDPRHSAFECVMHGFFESLVASTTTNAGSRTRATFRASCLKLASIRRHTLEAL
jgi:hypothetical protein